MQDSLTILAAKIDSLSGDSTQLDTAVGEIVKNVIMALGIVAVIVVLVGGIMYMTAAGDAGKVKTAKNTILGGVIGMVICALSFAIVNFAINNIINNAVSGGGSSVDYEQIAGTYSTDNACKTAAEKKYGTGAQFYRDGNKCYGAKK